MLKEYKLVIQAIGRDENEAVESAVRMLNEGASFDEVTYLNDWRDPLPKDSLCRLNAGSLRKLPKFTFLQSAKHRN